MAAKRSPLNHRQLIFKELFVGTLIYAVVLGFFNDYTSVVDATSFSTIFLAALVLETFTYFTLQLKDRIVLWLKHRPGLHHRALMVFCLWLVLFSSKFVFVWVIDLVFGSDMNIHGFFGIFAIVLCVTALAKLADYTFIKLGEHSTMQS